MNLPRAAVAASATTVTLWAVKAVIVGLSTDKNNLAASVVFIAGLAAAVVAVVLVGAALAAHRSVAWKALGVVLCIAGCAAIGTAVQIVVVRIRPAHPAWWWGELNLWAIMLALLGTALVVRRGELTSGAPSVAGVAA